MRVLLPAKLLVEDPNDGNTRERACVNAELSLEDALQLFGLDPVLDEVRVADAEFADHLKHLQVLEKHEELKFVVLAEVLQLVQCEVEVAPVQRCICERQKRILEEVQIVDRLDQWLRGNTGPLECRFSHTLLDVVALAFVIGAAESQSVLELVDVAHLVVVNSDCRGREAAHLQRRMDFVASTARVLAVDVALDKVDVGRPLNDDIGAGAGARDVSEDEVRLDLGHLEARRLIDLLKDDIECVAQDGIVADAARETRLRG